MNMNNNICQVKQNILVTLDTRNCTTIYNGDKFSDVEWDLSDVISKPKKAVEFSVSVINACIPIGQYNVVSTDNIDLVITIQTSGGSPFTVAISDGHYTITSLLSTIRGNLPAPYSIGYVDYRNRFYIINESGAAFTLKVSTGLAEPLGFVPNKTYSSEVGGSIIAPYCVNMSGLRKVNIHLDNLNTKNISSFTKSSSTIIASIPIDVNSMGVVSYNLSSDYEIPVPISSIDYINLLLKDDMGNFIANNVHWAVTLKFSYYIEQEFSTETLHEKVNKQKISIIQPKPMNTEIPKIFSSRKDLQTD